LDEAVELEDSRQLTNEQAYSIIRATLDELDQETDEMTEYRDYFNGDQELKFATEEFERAFGAKFKDLKLNWCETAITAIEERLELDRIVLRDGEDGEVDDDLTARLRDIFRDNDLEALENELYSSAMIEKRAALVVWPTGDDEDPFRFHVMRGRTFKIVYDDDDPTRIRWAVRRYRTQLGTTHVTLYTPEYVYKYKVNDQFVDLLEDLSDDASFEDGRFEPRPTSETGDPSWPLENPWAESNRVPIVEFRARKNRSELMNLLAVQDSINKVAVNLMVASDFASHQQSFIVTSNNEPDGGWKRRPGEVWQIQPEIDLDGKALPTTVGTLPAIDPSVYVSVIEHFLSEFSSLASVPSYYLFSSNSQSGRGDAPSGDSLRVTETKMMKKLEKYQERFEPQWRNVATLIMEFLGEDADYTEVVWVNAQKHFMGMLLEEANKMTNELGLPPWVGWAHIGMNEAAIAEAREWMEEQEQREQDRVMEQVSARSNAQAPGNGIPQNESNQMDNGGTPSNS
jgi:hypothetical protein